MKEQLFIFHFNIIEKYPPVLNFINDCLEKSKNYEIVVFTTCNVSKFSNQRFKHVTIFRLGFISSNAFFRYISYILFNLFGFFYLVFKRPKFVLAYETLSVFPVYLYNLFFKISLIHLHFHEYISLKEKKYLSFYMKFLFLCEKKLLKTAVCSHTNEDRKLFFLSDNPNIAINQVLIFPNYPPISWWFNFGKRKIIWSGGKIKLVYVGVLDAETLFLEEILYFVKLNKNIFEISFYSQDISKSALSLLKKYISDVIHVYETVDYFELPKVLIKYDIGLVLYKGHSLNYVYNIPNKVFEYLFCGLKVIFDSSNQTIKKNISSDILDLNFCDLNYTHINLIFDLVKKPKSEVFIDAPLLVDIF